MLATWVGPIYYTAGTDVPGGVGPSGYWLKATGFGAEAQEIPERRFDDLDEFVRALQEISPAWHLYGSRWICFSRRDVALYRATKGVLWSGNPRVTDHTSLLVAEGDVARQALVEQAASHW